MFAGFTAVTLIIHWKLVLLVWTGEVMAWRVVRYRMLLAWMKPMTELKDCTDALDVAGPAEIND